MSSTCLKSFRVSSLLWIVIAIIVGLGVLSCSRGPDPSETGQSSGSETVTPASPETENMGSPPAPDSTIAAVKERGELRVGMQIGYVPFEMIDKDGNPSGLDVEMAGLVARDLMANVKIVRGKWQELIPALLAGKTDVIMSGMAVTPSRNVEVLFTDPVVETGRMFLVHTANGARFRKFSDLNNPGIFVVAGPSGLGSVSVREALPRASYREFPDRNAALTEVLQNRAQAMVDDEFFIRYAAAAHAGTVVSHFQPITYERIAWAVRPGDFHWLNWLNNFIGMARRDGRLDKLKKKWLRDYFLDIHAGSQKTSPKP